MRRQQSFETFTQQTSQYGSRPTAGNRHHDGRTIDDGGEDEARTRRIIHYVDPQTGRIGGNSHSGIHHLIIGGGDYQPLIRQLLGAEFGIQMMQSSALRELL